MNKGSIDSICKLGHLCNTGGINRGSIGTGSITSQWRKLRIMSTTPKVILITQPMDVIYSALFEGDVTRQLPKVISFLIRLFMFFYFFWTFFRLKRLKKNKSDYSIQLGGDECRRKEN